MDNGNYEDDDLRCYLKQMRGGELSEMEKTYLNMGDHLKDKHKDLRFMAWKNILTVRCMLMEGTLIDMMDKDSGQMKEHIVFLINHTKIMRFFLTRFEE